MFTQTSEYALRAVVCLAHSEPESRTRSDLVDMTKVPSAYLAKVLKHLERAGIVNARRGQRGGFTLANPSDTISILDVVNAVDPVRRIKTCPLNIASHGTQLCPLHRKLDDALAAMEKAFRDTTIRELLRPKSESIPLCESAETLIQLGGSTS